MAKSEKSDFNPLGDGITFAVDGNTLHLRINLDSAKGKAIATGKR